VKGMNPDNEEIRLPLDVAVLRCDRIFLKCQQKAPNPNWYDFPSLALFRHLIQMGDAIHILILAGSSTPTIPLLRSMLESILLLKYIHRKDYKQRSLCMLCAYIHQEIAIRERLDPQSKDGKRFYEVIAEEFKGWRPNSFQEGAGARHDVAQLRELLANPELENIEERHRRHPRQKWYSMFDGPKNLYKLAKRVGMLSSYELFYRPWSTTVHGTDVSRLLDGKGDFQELRYLEEPDHMETHAEIYLQMAARLMGRKFLSERDIEGLVEEEKDIPSGKVSEGQGP
jgi:hypothetical protein